MTTKTPRRITPRRRESAGEESRQKRSLAKKHKKRRGLGDLFARALRNGRVIPFVKLTPRRWRALKVRWGFADACNCGERKLALNRFGRWIVKPFRRLRKALLPAPPAE